MWKKSMSIILCLSLVFVLSACAGNTGSGAGTAQKSKSNNAADLIPDVMTSSNGVYEIGFCHSDGGLKDGGFSEGTYNGIKLFASENNITYKYYGNRGSSSTDEDYYDSMKAAITGGASVVVVIGFQFATPLAKISKEYPDIKFIFVDGNPLEGCSNVAAVAFRDQECGYFAGYSAVKEGYTQLGFSGGGGGTNDAVNRYGYGYIQGAEAAAKETGVKVSMNYSYQYGSTFKPSPELQAMCNAWYDNGTEVIFSVGGTMLNSVCAAAASNDGWVIAPDSDMSWKSRTILTSALKLVDVASYYMLSLCYSGQWDTVGGKLTILSVKEGAIGLPTENWKFKNFTIEEYQKVLDDMVAGRIVVDGDFSKIGSTEHVTLKMM